MTAPFLVPRRVRGSPRGDCMATSLISVAGGRPPPCWAGAGACPCASRAPTVPGRAHRGRFVKDQAVPCGHLQVPTHPRPRRWPGSTQISGPRRGPRACAVGHLWVSRS